MLFLTLWLACDLSSSADTADRDTEPEHDELGGQEGEEQEDTTATTSSSDPLTADKPNIIFGEKPVGCVGEDVLAISNDSSQTRVISQVTMATSQTEITLADSAASYVLQPGSTLNVKVRYTPMDDRPVATTIQFWGEDATTLELEIMASGKGLVHSEGADVFSGNGTTTTFMLTEQAVPGTLQIMRDGAPMGPDLWSYVSQTNQLIFATPPEPLTSIDIQYVVPPPECQ